MGSACSSMLWHDQVVEEEKQGGAVTEEEPEFGSNPNSDVPPLGSEGGTASDVSMVDDGLTQHDLDVEVEEEPEEDMETSATPNPIVPEPPKESPTLQGSETEDGPPDDQNSQTSKDSTDMNPPQDSDIDEEELLGPATDVSVPGGYLDDSIALVVPPEEDNL